MVVGGPLFGSLLVVAGTVADVTGTAEVLAVALDLSIDAQAPHARPVTRSAGNPCGRRMAFRLCISVFARLAGPLVLGPGWACPSGYEVG